jgi:flagellar biosynthetic protein FlhB
MAEQQDNFERTEEASPKRREEARKKGTVPVSRAVIPTATLLAAVLILRFVGEEFILRLGRLFVGFFALAGARHEIGSQKLFSLSLESGMIMAPVLAPLFLGVAAAGIGAGLLQTGFLWTFEPLKPDFGRINPLSGLRRVFSLDALGELVKALVALAALGALGFNFLYGQLPVLASLSMLGVEELLLFVGREAMRVVVAGIGIMARFAGGDYFFKHWRTESKLKMSRQELKEEMREQEGDPLTKSRLKGVRQKISRRRMMAEVAKADVIVTNPDHLAVALRYKIQEMGAPKVVAKGAGFIAQKIKDIAAENGVPIVENKPLARLLYRVVEVGQEIHESLYRAVAEVLAYVYRLRRS